MPSETISSLVKFCTGDAAIKILSDRSLRWSAPHLFDDPFELHHASEIDVTAAGMQEHLLREALIMLFGPEPPTGRSNKLINVMARWREEQRFCDEQEANSVLRELLGQIADLQARQVDELMADWRRYARMARITCFSERPQQVECWQRYADNHAGVALRFDCGEGAGFASPQPVRYHSSAPVVTSLREQIDTILGRKAAPEVSALPENLRWGEKLLWKGRHSQHEREWRCFDSERDDPDGDESLWYDFRKFPAEALRGVYFGLRTTRADRDVVTKLVRRNYTAAKLYQARAVPGSYSIEFDTA